MLVNQLSCQLLMVLQWKSFFKAGCGKSSHKGGVIFGIRWSGGPGGGILLTLLICWLFLSGHQQADIFLMQSTDGRQHHGKPSKTSANNITVSMQACRDVCVNSYMFLYRGIIPVRLTTRTVSCYHNNLTDAVITNTFYTQELPIEFSHTVSSLCLEFCEIL